MAGADPGMGHLPRSRQGTQAVADRRDVPHVVVAAASSARAARACSPSPRPRWCRAAAPTARTSRDKKDKDHVEKLAKRARRRRVAVQGGQDEGRLRGVRARTRRGDRVAHPPGRRRVRVPQPPRLRGRPRLRAAPARDEHRAALHRDQARRVLAAAVALHRRGRGRRHGHLDAHRVRPRRLGRGRRGVRVVVHRGARGVHRREPVYRSMEEELRKMLGDAVYGEVVKYLDQRARSKPPPAPHPAETPVRFSRRRPATANGHRRRS